jgi:hypothetical protein
MGKVISAAVTTLVALVLVDQHFYSGRYADAMLAVRSCKKAAVAGGQVD